MLRLVASMIATSSSISMSESESRNSIGEVSLPAVLGALGATVFADVDLLAGVISAGAEAVESPTGDVSLLVLVVRSIGSFLTLTVAAV
jgi:hypothetical protein